MYLEGKRFKKYDDDYFISADGDVFSKLSGKILKHYIDKDGYHRVDIHGKHIKVHKLVWTTWKQPLGSNEQLNHKDDNKDNNNYSNLYVGSQKENIRDQIKNGKRVGNITSLTIYDKQLDETIVFPSAKHFIEYCGHSNVSGSFAKMSRKKWFAKRYILISQKRVETIEEYNELLKDYSELDLVE